MSNYTNNPSMPASAHTAGFAAAAPSASSSGAPHTSSSVASSGLEGDFGAQAEGSHPTPIAPSTYNAINARDQAAVAGHSASSAGASNISSFGNAAGNHPQHSEPNIPAAASNLAAKAPTAEEIKAKGNAFVDQSAALAEQAKVKAGELVAPKDKAELNPAEKHVDNLAGGIAGMVLTAPLAAVEKVSPVVADKLSAAAGAASTQLQDAANRAGPVASSYAQSAVDAARGVLPTALGGRPATTTDTVGSTTGTTTTSTGPTVTDRASSAAGSAQQTASNLASSASSTATSAAQSTQSALSSAAQTATGYLPASIANKLPGGGSTSSSTGSTSTSTDSPYVARDEIKPNTLPSDTLRDVSSSSKTSDLSSGSGSSTQFTGLAPATFSSPSHSAGSAATGGEHTSSTLDSRSTQPSQIYSTGNTSNVGTNQKSVYEDPSLATGSTAKKTQDAELHPSSQSAPSTEYNDGQRGAAQQPGATLGGSTAVSYEKA